MVVCIQDFVLQECAYTLYTSSLELGELAVLL